MRTVAECKERAEECRRLANLGADRRDWGHFEEMAQTWDMLARQKQERLRWKTTVLADRFRNVLCLSDIAPKAPPEADNNEKAA
jgi:GDP-D-mannose dehydratase